jgi:hypothetical protein
MKQTEINMTNRYFWPPNDAQSIRFWMSHNCDICKKILNCKIMESGESPMPPWGPKEWYGEIDKPETWGCSEFEKSEIYEN